MAPKRQAGEFTLKALRERCRDIESHVDARKLARDDERADRRPGGKDNPGHDRWAWVRWYGALVAFLDREDRGFPDEADPDAVVMDALRGEPLAVTLVAVDEKNQPRHVLVYPKSLDALLNCQARDWLLGWLAERLWALKTRGTAEDASHIEPVQTEISYQYALLAWIVTTPGPGMPFDPRTEKPEPPAWTLLLDPWDQIHITKAFSAVNAQRLVALDALVPRSEGGSSKRPSWSVFISRVGKMLKIAPSSLMRDYSLAELSATAYLGAPEPSSDGNGGGSSEGVAEMLDESQE